MGKHIIDLTGQIFGQLTVEKIAENYAQEQGYKNKRIYWQCRCSCGELYYATGDNLRRGKATRCKKCSNPATNLAGKIINNIKIIDQNFTYGKNKKNTHAYWNGICPFCQNIAVFRSAELIQGRVKSCQQCANNSFIDETGNRYGKLTITRYLGKKNNNSYWEAICDCGNIIAVVPNELRRRKHAWSCGCENRSNGEILIRQILKDNNINFKEQVTFKDFTSATKKRYAYDFGIYNSNNELIRLIEFDGKQHFYPIEFFGGEEELKETQRRDQLKNNYAKAHNIPLIRIPYTEINKITIDYLLKDKYLI
ncbi:MAG: hypothetical protein J6T10_23240 [Methanobrevibacter sp.]|nr:hypothetical protein [Methanobrevibacter sp.]